MPRKILSFLVCLSFIFIQSCASIFNSGSQSVIANTAGDEENVSVQVTTPSGSYKSKLPSTIVTTPSSFTRTNITVKDKCYEETQIVVGRSVTPAFWANFLWFLYFPVGMGVDYLTGDMWKMDQQVIVPLNKKAGCGKRG